MDIFGGILGKGLLRVKIIIGIGVDVFARMWLGYVKNFIGIIYYGWESLFLIFSKYGCLRGFLLVF